MQNIDNYTGIHLYEKIIENINNINYRETIINYRIILEELFKNLTSDEIGTFSSLHNMSQFIFTKYPIPYDIIDTTNAIRIFANKVAHNYNYNLTNIDVLWATFSLAKIIQFFSGQPIPQEIQNFYSNYIQIIQNEDINKKKKEKTNIPKNITSIESLKAVVIKYNKQEDKSVIQAHTYEDTEIIEIHCHNHKKWKTSQQKQSKTEKKEWENSNFLPDFSNITTYIMPHQTLLFLNLYIDKQNIYNTSINSIIVVEPDYILPVKDIASSISNSILFGTNHIIHYINLLANKNISIQIMKGYIAGKILDNANNDNYSYEDIFNQTIQENSINILSLYTEQNKIKYDEINKLYDDAKQSEAAIINTLNKWHNNKTILIEPNYISNIYGIQGRMDLIIFSENNQYSETIELKSTSYPPQTGIYPNDEAQVILYYLLLSSTYKNKKGNSYILYSSAQKDNLRVTTQEKIYSIQELITLRNKIVATDFKIANGDFTIIETILKQNDNLFPKYLKNNFNEIKHTIQNLDNLSKDYFYGFLRFIYKELILAKIGGTLYNSQNYGQSSLWQQPKEIKISNSNSIIYLNLKEIDDNFNIDFKIDYNLFTQGIISTFREGDMAILYKTPDPEKLNPLSTEIFKCQIINISHKNVSVKLINNQINKNYFTDYKGYWAIDIDFNDSGYKQMINSLYNFIKSDIEIRHLVFGIKQPSFKSENELILNDSITNLNESQKEQVINALKANNYYIIQGPPGTGKTSKVLTEIVNQISCQPQSKYATMIVAYTNRAVDEICSKLTERNMEFIRFGISNIKKCWDNISKEKSLEDIYNELIKINIFVSTINSLPKYSEIFKIKNNFHTLIIDEASQLLEPQIVGFLPLFKKWIFIGDDYQLPPVVLQSEKNSKSNSNNLKDIHLYNFRESIFYRLKKNAIEKNWDNAYGVLKLHYRMHQNIAEFSKQSFYNNVIEEATEKQKKHINIPNLKYKDIFQQTLINTLKKSNIIFINTPKSNISKKNDIEAKLISKIIPVIKAIDDKNDIGIITPFRLQINNIKNTINDKYQNIYDDIIVDTVERFQGSEKDSIIISFAINNLYQLCNIQSICEYNGVKIDRKLNVAITRAKNILIMLGSEQILSQDSIFKSLISYVKNKNGYIDFQLL